MSLPLPPPPLAQLVFPWMAHHVFRCLIRKTNSHAGAEAAHGPNVIRHMHVRAEGCQRRGIRMRHQASGNTRGTHYCCNIGLVASCGSVDTSGSVFRAEAVALRGASGPSGVFCRAKHAHCPSCHRLCPWVARRLPSCGQPPPFSQRPPPSSQPGRRKAPQENQGPRPKQPLAPRPKQPWPLVPPW